jgi:hypothetical protein
MNASESDPRKDEAGIAEHDDRETQLGYGEGRVPFYVAIIWLAFILSYGAIMFVLALPDFQAWSSR